MLLSYQRIAIFSAPFCLIRTITLGKACLEWIKAIWYIFNSPDNDPIVIGLLIAIFSLIAAYAITSRSNRRLIAEKDERIEDLTKQRNKFQNIVLQSKGIERKSSKGSS